MNKMTKLLVSVSGISIAMLGVSPAFAAGTTAGDSITNNVTVEYQVGGVDQTDVTASDTFVVDRAINISVAEEGNVTTLVSPGETEAVTTFLVTNASNDVVDIGLAGSQIVGGTAAHGGTDNFNVGVLFIAEDTNNNGVFDPVDAVVTYLDEMAEDETRRVFIVGDAALAQVNGDVAGVTLTGTARAGGTASTQGAVITASASPTASEDTVFADADGVYDGISFDNDDYTVAAANLSVVKISEVLAAAYPITGATEFFNIPGARVQYCIVVANAAGGSAATNLVITDTVPGDTTFVAGSIMMAGTYDDNSTPGDTTDDSCTAGPLGGGGSFDGSDVTVSIPTLDAGNSMVITFEATID